MREFLREYGHFERDFPEIAGAYKGNLVICADAMCVWDDLENFGCRGDNRVAKAGWQFMTVNKMVEVFPGDIEHCYSNSPSCLQRFVAARRDEYTSEFAKPRHLHAISPGVEHVWPFAGFGTSGLGAALVAVALGYTRIVLCGMPLDDGPHNGEPHWRKTGFTTEAADSGASGKNRYWAKAKELAFDGKVRSMSGRTKAWLGDAMEWA